MKSGSLRWFSFHYEFPVKTEPLWKDHVQRWYQLDAYAYGLVSAYSQWQRSLSLPNFLILASPTASNETDKTFVENSAISPAHFAHTLPNIRCSPLCQIMKWSGPVLCIQKDPHSQVQGLIEGFELLSAQCPVVWVLSVFKKSGRYEAHCFQLSDLSQGIDPKSFEFQKTNNWTPSKTKTDVDLHQWLKGQTKEASLFSLGAYEVMRKEFF